MNISQEEIKNLQDISSNTDNNSNLIYIKTLLADIKGINQKQLQNDKDQFNQNKSINSTLNSKIKSDKQQAIKKDKQEKKDREERYKVYKFLTYPFKKGWEKLTALPGLIKDKIIGRLENYGFLGKTILGAGNFVKDWFQGLSKNKTSKKSRNEVEDVDELDSKIEESSADVNAQDTRQNSLAEESSAKSTEEYHERVLSDLDWIAKNMGKQEETKTGDATKGKGLFGTILGKAKDFLLDGFSFLKDGILGFGKGALKMGSKLLSGLSVGGVAALGAISAATTFAIDVYNDGLATTMERTAGDLQERWEKGDYVGMLMHPVDTLVGAAGLWGEKSAEVWNGIIGTFTDFGKGIGDWFSNAWDDFMNWLPWPFGKSKEDTKRSRDLKSQGLSASEIEEFDKENTRRSAMNDEAMTVEEFKEKKKMERDAEEKRKRNAEKENERQKSTEYRKKHASILKRMHDENRETMTEEEIAELRAVGADDPRYAQEAGATLEKQDYARLYAKHHPKATAVSRSVSTSAKIEKPELKDTTSTSGGKDNGKTVIINQGSSNGVAIPDVIGNAGTAALAMSNI